MEIGMIGLGKMGYNLSLQMIEKGKIVKAYDPSLEAQKMAADSRIMVMDSLEELVKGMTSPRLIWIMVPAGDAVNQVLNIIVPLCNKGDIIIDGGNSHYKDSIARYEKLKEKGVFFADIGTSGGLEGARNGACLMVGCDKEIEKILEESFSDITVPGGYLRTGEPGSGHFVKMVHNGIEYGMMQAIGEGFNILENSNFDLNHSEVAKVWSNGSVIRGWLMELAEKMFSEDKNLNSIKGVVGSSGEGLWTLQEALEQKTSAPCIAAALFTRFESQVEDSYSNKVVAGLRNQFGGHSVIKIREGK